MSNEKTTGRSITALRTCRECGCTEDNCSQCIEATGEPCHWVEVDLCSRCQVEEMRPAFMDETRVSLEAHFYSVLKKTDIAEELLAKYPNQSHKELAKTMAIGMIQSKCGDFARLLCAGDKVFPNYPAICQEAFKNVILRVLNEQAESDQ